LQSARGTINTGAQKKTRKKTREDTSEKKNKKQASAGETSAGSQYLTRRFVKNRKKSRTTKKNRRETNSARKEKKYRYRSSKVKAMKTARRTPRKLR